MENSPGILVQLTVDIRRSNEVLTEIKKSLQFRANLTTPDNTLGLLPNAPLLENWNPQAQLLENRHELCVLSLQFKDSVSSSLSNWNTLENAISKEIDSWKFVSRRTIAVGGGADPPPLPAHIQSGCGYLFDMIAGVKSQIKRARELLPEQGSLQIDVCWIEGLASSADLCLKALLIHSFTVDQMPALIKTDTSLKTAPLVRLLLHDKVGLDRNGSGPLVRTRVISEEEARSLPLLSSEKPPLFNVLQGEGYLGEDGAVKFDKFLLSLNGRRPIRDGLVPETKMCLYASCVVNIGELKVEVYTISSPFVVITGGIQTALATAKIMWDYAFGELTRVPFHISEDKAVRWEDLSGLLNTLCVNMTGCSLSVENLRCLRQKLFANPNVETITYRQLCKVNLINRPFSFWTWFYSALRAVSAPVSHQQRSHLHNLFSQGLIVGFMMREDAEAILRSSLVGTFLVRFTNSIPGTVSIAFLNNLGLVEHIDPMRLNPHNLAADIRLNDKLQDVITRIPDEIYGTAVDKNSERAFGNYEIIQTVGYNFVHGNGVAAAALMRMEIEPLPDLGDIELA